MENRIYPKCFLYIAVSVTPKLNGREWAVNSAHSFLIINEVTFFTNAFVKVMYCLYIFSIHDSNKYQETTISKFINMEVVNTYWCNRNG